MTLEMADLILNPPGTLRTITNPHWASKERKTILAAFHYPDGRILEAAVSNGIDGSINPDWTEILSLFPLEEIERNTQAIDDIEVKRKEAATSAREKAEEEATREKIFAMKLEALEKVELIKNSTNIQLKKLLRKAQTMTEVNAFSTIIILDALEKASTSSQ